METGNKPIREWKHIMLDTGVILALFAAQRGSADPVITFINKLITFLCRQGTGKSEKRVFYISTISLGEIITNESGVDKIKRILRVLDSDNVEFLSFDTSTALEFNVRLQPYLERGALHEKAKELGFATQDYGMARQWISKDYMIAMSGIVKPVDVILTADKKTFYPICKDFVGTACVLTYPDLFLHTDSNIMEYDFRNVQNFLLNKPFQTLNEVEGQKPSPAVQVDLFGQDAPIDAS